MECSEREDSSSPETACPQPEKRRKLNQWNEERMKGALKQYSEQVEAGQLPQIRLLARAWNVPKSTLQRRVKGLVKGYEHAIGRNPIISQESEAKLAELIRSLAKTGFPMSKVEVQNLAFQFAKANKIRGFSEIKKRAGYYWFEGFLKRNPGLSFRKTEAVSAVRAACLKPAVVRRWFENYESILNSLGIRDVPSHIWNCDEVKLQENPTSTNSEAPCHEGVAATVLASLSAAGEYGPLQVIFKSNQLRAEWLSSNTTVRVSENGQISSDLFLDWGKQFVAALPKDDPRPHVLLVNSDSSHVFNLDFLSEMLSHNVHVVRFPVHTKHVLQPSQRTLFKILKHHWSVESKDPDASQSRRKKPQRKDFFSLLMKVWLKSATAQTARAGFCESGIYPLNASLLISSLDNPFFTAEIVQEQEPCVLPPNAQQQAVSSPFQQSAPPGSLQPSISSPLQCSPLSFLEYPSLSLAQMLTSHAPVCEVEVDEAGTSSADICPAADGAKPNTRKNSILPCFHVATKGHVTKGTKTKNKKQQERQVKAQKTDDRCAVCRKMYGQSGDSKHMENWIACFVCHNWFHESCGKDTGAVNSDDGSFTCKECLV